MFWVYEFFRLEVYLGLSTGGPLRLHGNCVGSFIIECMGINKFKLPYTCINYIDHLMYIYKRFEIKMTLVYCLFACRTVSELNT